MRVVLPGAQALLGFQFATMLVEGFDKLPASSKYVHLLSLTLIAFSVVLLMTPAAYHRIVERGHETEHFHRFTSRMLIAAMLPLALGMCGDFFVVIRKVTASAVAAIVGAALMLLFFYGLWFGYTLYRRGQKGETHLASAADDDRQYASR
jgi:DMSO reductase anchor subunit